MGPNLVDSFEAYCAYTATQEAAIPFINNYGRLVGRLAPFPTTCVNLKQPQQFSVRLHDDLCIGSIHGVPGTVGMLLTVLLADLEDVRSPRSTQFA